MKILATSGGFLRPTSAPSKWRRGPLIEHAIHLAGDPDQPRFCFVGTASGDSLNGTVGFYSAFAGSDVRASHLELFLMPNVADVRAHLLAQDVIWVNGGSVANLLAVWRTHGLDEVMRECWEAGVVLGGVSAGSICWYVGGTDRQLRHRAAAGPQRAGAAALRQRRPLRQRGPAPSAAAQAGRRRHPADLARHRRRCRTRLRGHRAGRGRLGPAGRRGVPGGTPSGRHRRRDPDRATPAARAEAEPD